MISRSPRPTPTGNPQRDIQSIMTWIQNAVDGDSSQDGRTRLSVVLKSSPYAVAPSDDVVQVDVTADHDVITLDAASLLSGGKSRTVTVMKHDSSGNTFNVVNPSGLVNFQSLMTVSGRSTSVTFYAKGPDLFVL